MDIGGSNETQQTIEQEYQAYVTAPLLSKQTDVLKFWEVSNVITSASGTDELS